MPHFIHPDLIYGRVELEVCLRKIPQPAASSVFVGPFSDVRARRIIFRFFLGESKKNWAKKQLNRLAHHSRPGHFLWTTW